MRLNNEWMWGIVQNFHEGERGVQAREAGETVAFLVFL